jgi:hypothetical protein
VHTPSAVHLACPTALGARTSGSFFNIATACQLSSYVNLLGWIKNFQDCLAQRKSGVDEYVENSGATDQVELQ